MYKNVIRIGARVELPENEIEYEYCRASGPGGQYVNCTDSAVQLRFDALHSPSLPEDVRIRLLSQAGNAVTAEGAIVLKCQKFRQQLRNRFAVREQLIGMLLKAVVVPSTRRATGVPRISKEARLELKHRVSVTKRRRARPRLDGDVD